jgi:Ran GTPase-activating protein (RanGAP) involved in mRNA processing and transport
VLRKCPRLVEVNLESNQLGDRGAAFIADAMESNTSVRILRLGRNGIRKEGTMAIAGKETRGCGGWGGVP